MNVSQAKRLKELVPYVSGSLPSGVSRRKSHVMSKSVRTWPPSRVSTEMRRRFARARLAHRG